MPGDPDIPYARFRAALDGGDLEFIRRHAHRLPPVRLGDALEICLLYRDRNPRLLEAASLRWIGRFAIEVPAATIADVRQAVEALEALPRDAEGAMESLQELCLRHGLG
jgi:hypothetical protein